MKFRFVVTVVQFIAFQKTTCFAGRNVLQALP